jgi:hypothetical protein
LLFSSSPAGLITLLQVLPLAAARYNDFTKHTTPFSVVVVADGFYLSSGFLNVLLYRYTRPYLLPHRIDSDGSDMEMESADPEYEASESTHHQDGTYYRTSVGTYYRTSAFSTSPVRDESHIGDEPTGAGATNIDEIHIRDEPTGDGY